MATRTTSMPLSLRPSLFAALSREERAFFVASWLLAPAATAGLKVAGFRRMTDLLRRVPARKSVLFADVGVERAESLVRRAFRWSIARWSVRDGGCLPQSMVQYAVHTLGGDEVRFVVGVQRGEPAPVGFEAHAWIEDARRTRPDRKHEAIFELTAT
ncbi:MAG: lasso peptide biosynthesis B2 protein [Polyangiaceae bacterium]|nr:lasso peptide biosynthesis B2 protein [Polyangiaceae bacterium]